MLILCRSGCLKKPSEKRCKECVTLRACQVMFSRETCSRHSPLYRPPEHKEAKLPTPANTTFLCLQTETSVAPSEISSASSCIFAGLDEQSSKIWKILHFVLVHAKTCSLQAVVVSCSVVPTWLGTCPVIDLYQILVAGGTHLVQGILGQAEQLALRVCLPPVTHALDLDADAVAAVQGRKLLLHVCPELRHQIIWPLVRHKPDTASNKRSPSARTHVPLLHGHAVRLRGAVGGGLWERDTCSPRVWTSSK